MLEVVFLERPDIITNLPYETNNHGDQPLWPIQPYCEGKLPKKLDDNDLDNSKKCVVQARSIKPKKQVKSEIQVTPETQQ